MRRSKPIALGLFAALAIGGCVILSDDSDIRPCVSARDCPPNYYECTPWYPDGGKICQVVFPPVNAPDGAGGGNGSGGGSGGGPAPIYYCDQIKPIIDVTCVQTCHGQAPTNTLGSGDTSFRLDVYSNPAGPQVGIFEKKDRVKYRMADIKSMPPAGNQPVPTDAQRQLVSDWVVGGALESSDGGHCTGSGGGGGSGGGSGGGGGNDAGSVSYATQVQPIFNSRCGPCHLIDVPRKGGLDLSASASYVQLVNQPTVCNAGANKRVNPSSPSTSVLYQKVSAAAVCGASAVMPPQDAGQQISAQQQTAIFNWIFEGAPNN